MSKRAIVPVTFLTLGVEVLAVGGLEDTDMEVHFLSRMRVLAFHTLSTTDLHLPLRSQDYIRTDLRVVAVPCRIPARPVQIVRVLARRVPIAMALLAQAGADLGAEDVEALLVFPKVPWVCHSWEKRRAALKKKQEQHLRRRQEAEARHS